MRPILCSRTKSGFTLNIIDTPGLVEGGCVNDQAMDVIKRYKLLTGLMRGHVGLDKSFLATVGVARSCESLCS